MQARLVDLRDHGRFVAKCMRCDVNPQSCINGRKQRSAHYALSEGYGNLVAI